MNSLKLISSVRFASRGRFTAQVGGRTSAYKNRPVKPLSKESLEPVKPAAETRLMVPVRYPPALATNTLPVKSPAGTVLGHPALVVTRQMEMLNVFLGYEQANKYALKDPKGVDVGFIAEEDTSFKSSIIRQLMRTRRAFKADVLDVNGTVVLKIDRPTKWFLNSAITIRDSSDNVIGEVRQVFHLWKRHYDLFLKQTQFAQIRSGLLAWDFTLLDEGEKPLGAVNRNFVGFAREIFTDAGQYAIQMDAFVDPIHGNARPLSLDERAIVLASAITIDIDYFSRHSSHSGGLMPIPLGMGGSGDAPVAIPSAGEPPIIMPTDIGGPPVPPFTSNPPSNNGSTGSSEPTSDNQWGDTPFLNDEQAGVSDQEGSSWISSIKDFFDD